MKFLICGVGSIGERHIKNLLDLGYSDIVLYRTRNRDFRTLKGSFITFNDLQEALDCRPDAAIICNPTHLHGETALKCAEAGCDLLIEKPLSHSIEDVENLKKIGEEKNLKIMVGYMLRFHPCLVKMKEVLARRRIGDIISWRSQWGEYLPDWHPYENYRDTYAAKSSMGGGPALSLSHDIDLALWSLGVPQKITGYLNWNSALELECEHGIDIMLEYASGVTGAIHLDYYQKPPARNFEIAGKKGKMIFDYYRSRVSIHDHDNPDPEIIDYTATFDRNDMFVNELKYFLTCRQEDRTPVPGLLEGENALKISLESLNSGKKSFKS